MSRVFYARKSFEDIERLADFLIDVNPSAAWETGKIIHDGISVLERHPLIGRPVEAGLRELVTLLIQQGNVCPQPHSDACGIHTNDTSADAITGCDFTGRGVEDLYIAEYCSERSL